MHFSSRLRDSANEPMEYERGLTRSERKFGRGPKAYFSSIPELKRRRGYFLKSKPRIYWGTRYIGGGSADFGLLEAVVRFGPGYQRKRHYKTILSKALNRLIAEFGNEEAFEVSLKFSFCSHSDILNPFKLSLTCNAVLQKTQGNSFSYSIWYGQQFSNDWGSVHADNILREVYKVKTLADLAKLPHVLSYDNLWADFAKTFDGGSAVSIVDLTHYVFIFR